MSYDINYVLNEEKLGNKEELKVEPSNSYVLMDKKSGEL